MSTKHKAQAQASAPLEDDKIRLEPGEYTPEQLRNLMARKIRGRFDAVRVDGIREILGLLDEELRRPAKPLLRSAAIELWPLVISGRDQDEMEAAAMRYIKGERPWLIQDELDTQALVEAVIVQHRFSQLIASGLTAKDAEDAINNWLDYLPKDKAPSEEENLCCLLDDQQREGATDYLQTVTGCDDDEVEVVVNFMAQRLETFLSGLILAAITALRPVMLSGRPSAEIVSAFEQYAEDQIVPELTPGEKSTVEAAEKAIAQRRAMLAFRNAAIAAGLVPDSMPEKWDQLRRDGEAAVKSYVGLA